MKISRPGMLVLVALFSQGAFAADATFDSIFALPGLWSLSQDDFQKATQGLPFEWTSAARDSARAASRGMMLFGLPLVEAIARFDANKLASFTANIYARGDAGTLSKERFEALVRDSVTAITKSTNVKFVDRGKDPSNAVKAEGLLWKTNSAQYTLEYSFTKEVKAQGIPFRAEFIRLEITPPPKGFATFATVGPIAHQQFSGSAHVQRNAANGDVFIKDVPMVDQGQKGYCVVASTERVMRYYGLDVDANELAQMANSDAGGGTGYQEMMAALKKGAVHQKVSLHEIEKLDVLKILSLIKDYNRVAKKDSVSAIAEPGGLIDLGEIFSEMNGNVLREARTKSKADLTRFQHSVVENTDKGIPLLWTVQLGLLQNDNVPQSGGGHMRLIIGYNTKTDEILFSDSWGAGHELKRMPTADAWTMTTGVAKIEPR